MATQRPPIVWAVPSTRPAACCTHPLAVSPVQPSLKCLDGVPAFLHWTLSHVSNTAAWKPRGGSECIPTSVRRALPLRLMFCPGNNFTKSLPGQNTRFRSTFHKFWIYEPKLDNIFYPLLRLSSVSFRYMICTSEECTNVLWTVRHSAAHELRLLHHSCNPRHHTFSATCVQSR